MSTHMSTHVSHTQDMKRNPSLRRASEIMFWFHAFIVWIFFFFDVHLYLKKMNKRVLWLRSEVCRWNVCILWPQYMPDSHTYIKVAESSAVSLLKNITKKCIMASNVRVRRWSVCILGPHYMPHHIPTSMSLNRVLCWVFVSLLSSNREREQTETETGTETEKNWIHRNNVITQYVNC